MPLLQQQQQQQQQSSQTVGDTTLENGQCESCTQQVTTLQSVGNSKICSNCLFLFGVRKARFTPSVVTNAAEEATTEQNSKARYRGQNQHRRRRRHQHSTSVKVSVYLFDN